MYSSHFSSCSGGIRTHDTRCTCTCSVQRRWCGLEYTVYREGSSWALSFGGRLARLYVDLPYRKPCISFTSSSPSPPLPLSPSLSQETDRYLKETEERERKNLNRVLLEERSWFCGFVTAYTRVLVSLLYCNA